MAAAAAGLASTVRYWLSGHPIIVNFSWTPGQTVGSSPLFVGTTVLSYLTLTLLLSRLPVSFSVSSAVLRPIKAVHSGFLLVLSTIMTAGSILTSAAAVTTHGHLQWVFCYPPGTPPSGPHFFWAYVFYFSKLIEFGDTLLIILGGPEGRRRLTFLHVYHHSMAVVMCYNALRAAQSMFPVVIAVNASVHVLMYGYYALCAVGMRPRWKRTVTDCQIAQFKISFAGVALVLYYHFAGGGCSGTWSWCFNLIFNASLLFLFLDFHAKNYNGGFYYFNKDKLL